MVKIFFLLILNFGLISCASYTTQTAEVRMSYRQYRYDNALATLEKSDLKDQSRNRLLYRLEKAMILDRLDDKKSSQKTLLEADKIADDLYTTSISKSAASFLYNDSATDYEGEDYEKVAIHTMLALSFLEENNLNSAQISARKINNKLYEINQKYDDNKNAYGIDAFALYLSGMIHEAQKDYSAAIIDYRKALNTYSDTYAKKFNVREPESLVRSLYALAVNQKRREIVSELEKDWSKYIPKDKQWVDKYFDQGQIIVIHELDTIAVKTHKDFVFGAGKQLIRFSYPVIVSRSHSYGKTGIEIAGQNFSDGEPVQDMDSIAHQTLEDKRFRVLAKSAGRLLAKGQLTEQAYKNFGPIGGIAANIYSAVSETADTRGWTLLPRMFYVTRVNLAPGKHEVKVFNESRIMENKRINLNAKEIKFLRVFDRK